MKNLEEALWQDYVDAGEKLEHLNSTSGEGAYSAMLEERDRVRNELIKLRQNDQENDSRVNQYKSEEKRDKIRNIITAVTFGISTVVSIAVVNKTFKFDETSTVTSTAGRPILNGVISRIFKRN